MAYSPGFGNFTPSSCLQNISDTLSGRAIDQQRFIAWITKTVLEYSRDYPFQGLQEEGPVVQLIAGVNKYTPDFFMKPQDSPSEISRVESFFVFYGYPYVPSSQNSVSTGVELRWCDFREMSSVMQTWTIPSRWSRFGGSFYIGPTPDQPYSAIMRFQKQHPVISLNTPILLDDDWQDLVEYGAAFRAAVSYRLFDIATNLKNLLYGDPKFQMSGGTEGEPGLIFRRVSQRERDSVTSNRRVRLVMGR